MSNLLHQRPTSLRDKLAQLMFVRIGSNLSPVRTVEEDAQRIAELLERCPLGGLLLFNGRRDKTPQTLSQLQSQSQYPLLVASDIERGVGQQIIGHTMFPHAMAFDALGDEAETAVRQFAQLTAASARASGIHVTFAPVADVNIDPRNPIIATRAFGTDPQRVAQLVGAFIESCQAEGLLATAKHFPGHGNTHEDSHSALPCVNSTREELDACDLVPFRAAIEAQVGLIMTAHVQYPKLDQSGKPATLSRPILTDLLRNQLGFRGAVASDSLLMEGVKRESADEGMLAIDSLNAGVDLLLDVADPMRTLEAMEDAVAKGSLSQQCVDQAFERVWKLKEFSFGECKPPEAGEKRAADVASDCARRAVTVVRDEPTRLPLSPEKSLMTILIKPFETHLDAVEQPLAEDLRQRFPKSTYFELGPNSEQAELDEILANSATAEQILIAMIVKPAAWHRFGLDEKHERLLHSLLGHKCCVLASLGTPEALKPFDAACVKICTYSDVPVSQLALAEKLIG